MFDTICIKDTCPHT